ncbi:MAG: cytochrome C [Desulfobacterales bacterium]|nr:cytochrome C [Desulfobacterales bacterium]
MHRFMKMGSYGYRYARARAAALLLVCLLAAVAAWSAGVAPPFAQQRADLIVIDRLKAFGPLERPPVLFAHDRHTAALAEQNQDCLACHQMDPAKNVLSPQYRHLGTLDRRGLADLFHEGCIGCHQELRARKVEAGPVTCGDCHAEDVAVAGIREPMGLDRSLHYRHAKASENKCERCHHEYDPAAKKLVYTKGKEGACLYCHKQQTEENRISNRLASHQACIACHRDLRLQKQTAGPVECGGCHDPKQRAAIEQVGDIPRMARNQPDAALVKIQPTHPTEPSPQASMPQVAFNHQSHESYANQCRTCHHAAMTPCADCHTIQGHIDGQRVKLAQAMHQPDSTISCVGCHARRQAEAECVGCHGAINASRAWSNQTSCKVCHLAPSTPVPEPLTDEEAKALAAALVAARRTEPALLPWEEIPEIITIKHLKDQYEPAPMPHRRIVRKLTEQIQDSRLAAAFHGAPLTVCQACHHNTPASLKPPECRSCHSATPDAVNLERPGLMAAYHEQCMQCHARMKLAKPDTRDCTACHANRAT